MLDNSFTINLPATVNSGDLLLICTENGNNRSSTFPGAWTELFDTGSSDVACVVAYKIADGSEGGTSINVTLSGSSAKVGACLRITNWHGTTPPEATVSAFIAGGQPDPPSETASWGTANNLWIVFAACDPNSLTVSSYPTNYTMNQSVQAGGAGTSGMMVLASRELNAATENPGAFTMSSTSNCRGSTIVIRPV